MTRKVKLAALLAGTGVAVLATPAGPALSGVAQQLVDDPEAVRADPPDAAPPIPELTGDERAAAIALLETDPKARRFLRGRGFSVAEVGPWTTEDGTTIGASLVVALERPASYGPAEWPAATFTRGARGRPFREDVIPMTAQNVTRLRVLIDAGRSAVVGIEPDADGATLTPGPGIQRVEPEDPGY